MARKPLPSSLARTTWSYSSVRPAASMSALRPRGVAAAAASRRRFGRRGSSKLTHGGSAWNTVSSAMLTVLYGLGQPASMMAIAMARLPAPPRLGPVSTGGGRATPRSVAASAVEAAPMEPARPTTASIIHCEALGAACGCCGCCTADACAASLRSAGDRRGRSDTAPVNHVT